MTDTPKLTWCGIETPSYMPYGNPVEIVPGPMGTSVALYSITGEPRWTDPLDYPGDVPCRDTLPSGEPVGVTETDTPEDIASKLEQARDVLYRQ